MFNPAFGKHQPAPYPRLGTGLSAYSGTPATLTFLELKKGSPYHQESIRKNNGVSYHFDFILIPNMKDRTVTPSCYAENGSTCMRAQMFSVLVAVAAENI